MTVSPDEARRIALALPEAQEQDHHRRPSFRVGGAIFATLLAAERSLDAMLDEDGIPRPCTSSPPRAPSCGGAGA